MPTDTFFVRQFSSGGLFVATVTLFALKAFLTDVTPTFNILLKTQVVRTSKSTVVVPLLVGIVLATFPIRGEKTTVKVFNLIVVATPTVKPALSK